MADVTLATFKHLVADDGPIALTLIRELEPAEGKDAWIFPPTFAGDDNADDDGESGSGRYCIDRWEEPPQEKGFPPVKRNVCLISSVGSQANFIEPIFKKDKYQALVPQHEVKFKDGSVVNLLDAGHRAADASFRFSKELGQKLWSAFNAIKTKRNYSELIRIAPTSLVFGSWDSRGTGAKCQRIARSVIRAYNVIEASRSAIYNPPIDYVDRDLISSELDKGQGKDNPLSQEGFKHSPASGSHGGVRVTGKLQLEAAINLVALRMLSSEPKHRQYLLGLCLVALTYEDAAAFNLREGCLLRPSSTDCAWNEIHIDKRKDQPIRITHQQALVYATLSTTGEDGFRVEQPDKPAEFDPATAEAWVAKPKKERKKLAKKGHPSVMIKIGTSSDPISDLRSLVESLEPNKKDEFRNAKNSPLVKLGTKVSEINSDPEASEELKAIAQRLEPLLNPGAGAADRKAQMLRILPAASDATKSEETGQMPDQNVGAGG
jgi:CRISPR-associated protein Csb1